MSAPGRSPHQPLPAATAIVVVILLAVPILAILLVPIYARSGPAVDGWPFFYWYQVVWVPLSAIFTGSAYLVVRRARANEDGARANQDGARANQDGARANEGGARANQDGARAGHDGGRR